MKKKGTLGKAPGAEEVDAGRWHAGAPWPALPMQSALGHEDRVVKKVEGMIPEPLASARMHTCSSTQSFMQTHTSTCARAKNTSFQSLFGSCSKPVSLIPAKLLTET